MDTNTKIVLGVAVAAAAGAGYYFLVYKPGQEEKKKAEGQKTPKLPEGPQTVQSFRRPSSVAMARPATSTADVTAEGLAAAEQRARIAAMSQRRVAFSRAPEPEQTQPQPPKGNVASESVGGSYKIPFVGGVSWGADANVTFDLPTVSLKANGDATVSVFDGFDNLIGTYKLAQGQSIGIADIIRAAQGG